MKNLKKITGLILAAVMLICVFPQISLAADDEFGNILISEIAIRYKNDMPEEELRSGTGETAGVFVYGNFLLVPINYKGECPGITPDDRSCIAVYRLGGNDPVYLGRWNKADLGIPIRDEGDASKEDLIKGMTINDEYIAVETHTVRKNKANQREVGLFLYENPLKDGRFDENLSPISLGNENPDYGCTIIASEQGVPNTNIDPGFTLYIKDDYLISFMGGHSPGAKNAVVVTDLTAGDTVKWDEATLFADEGITPDTVDDIVFEGNRAYVLGSLKELSDTVITVGGGKTYYARKLVLYTVDISDPKNPSVLSYVTFDSDYPFNLQQPISGTPGTNNSAQQRTLSLQNGYAYVTGHGATMANYFENASSHLIVLKQNGDSFNWVSKIPLRSGEGSINYHGRGLGEIMAIGDVLVAVSADSAYQNNKVVIMKMNDEKTQIINSQVTDRVYQNSGLCSIKGCKYRNNTVIFGGMNSGYNAQATSDTNGAFISVINVLSADGEWDTGSAGGNAEKIKNMLAGFEGDYLKSGSNGIYIKGIAPEGGISFKVVKALYADDTLESVDVSDEYAFSGNEEIDITESMEIDYNDINSLSARVYLWNNMEDLQPVAYAISPQTVSFEFALDNKAVTSAGVYDKNDRLIKTLWSVVEYDAGVHRSSWDGTDDYGNIVPDGDYTVKVASNNVVYEKLIPVIGNTSDCSGWDTFISSYNSIFDMAYDAGTGHIYYCSDHVEGGDGLRFLNANDLSRNGGLLKSGNKTATNVATDGERVYWGTAELNMTSGDNMYSEDVRSFVHATDMNGTAYKFTDDAAWQPVSSKWNEGLWKTDGVTPATNYPYSINYVLRKGRDYDEATVDLSKGAEFIYDRAESGDNYNRIGGIEVQQNGNYLMTAYRDYNKVFINNKITGTRISILDINEPSAMAMSVADDNYIYIAYRSEEGKCNIGKFQISQSGTLNKVSDPITGLDTVIAMAVDPTNTKIAVVEGGSTEKMSIYTNPTGEGAAEKLMTYGSGESYVTDPTVKDDKFMFDDGNFAYSEPYEHSFVEFDSGNTLLIGDSGNGRIFKMDVSGSSPEIVDRIEFQSTSYNAWCVENDPEHIFSNSREYSLDYEKLEAYIAGRADKYDYEGFEDTWKLEKNYRLYINEYLPEFKSALRGEFYRATKLSNGYTYFGMNTTDGVKMYKQSPGGAITPTGISLDNTDLHADGSLWRREKLNNRDVYYSRELAGFDADNNPVYEAEVKRADIDFTGKDTIGRQSYSLINLTDSNKLVWLYAPGPMDREGDASMADRTEDYYDSPTGEIRMHLAAVDLNRSATEIAWATAPETLRRNENFFPSDGYYNIGNRVKYTAMDTMTYKNNVLYHYRGEGYERKQANKITHFTDDGLLVTVYGRTWREYGGDFQTTYSDGSISDGGEGAIKDANACNSFCTTMAGVPGNPNVAYIFQNTEGAAGGVHLTRVSGLETIKTQTASVTLKNGMTEGIKYTVFNSNDLNSATVEEFGITEDLHLPIISDTEDNSRSVRFEGYFRAEYDDNYRFAVETDGRASLYIDSQRVIEEGGEAGVIRLGGNRLYKFVLEVRPSEDGTLSKFEAGYLSGGVYVGLDQRCCSAFRPKAAENGKINLLDGIKYGAREDGILGRYGWSFESILSPDDIYSSSKIEANNWTYRRDMTPDINMEFYVQNFSKDISEEMRVERALGDIESDSWKIEMDVRWQSEFSFWKQGFIAAEDRGDYGANGWRGNVIEILDAEGRTIANFYIFGAGAMGNGNGQGKADSTGGHDEFDKFYVMVNDKDYFTTPKDLKRNGFKTNDWYGYVSISKYEVIPFNLPNTLTFEADGDKVKVKYGDWEAKSFDIVDPKADITRPAIVRFAGNNNRQQIIDYRSAVGSFATNVTRFEITKDMAK